MSQTDSMKPAQAQDKLRELIRSEVQGALEDQQGIDKPAPCDNKKVSLLMAAAITPLLIFLIVPIAYMGHKSSTALEQSIKVMEMNSQMEADHTQAPKVAVQLIQDKYPLEFLLGSATALMLTYNQQISEMELSHAVDYLSKRRSHDIGEPVGTVPHEGSGALLDRTVMMNVLEHSVGYLMEGTAVPGMRLDGVEQHPLNSHLVMRQERMIALLDEVVRAQEDPQTINNQLREYGRQWLNESHAGIDENERSLYEVMIERIHVRLNPHFG